MLFSRWTRHSHAQVLPEEHLQPKLTAVDIYTPEVEARHWPLLLGLCHIQSASVTIPIQLNTNYRTPVLCAIVSHYLMLILKRLGILTQKHKQHISQTQCFTFAFEIELISASLPLCSRNDIELLIQANNTNHIIYFGPVQCWALSGRIFIEL